MSKDNKSNTPFSQTLAKVKNYGKSIRLNKADSDIKHSNVKTQRANCV